MPYVRYDNAVRTALSYRTYGIVAEPARIATMSPEPDKKLTQVERSARTRAKILDATVTCLVEKGYRGTTISSVTALAGASRGAHQHHFAFKSEGVIAAIEYLAQQRILEVRSSAEQLAKNGAIEPGAALDLMWSTLSGRLYSAAVELWLAARTDEALREALVPAERRIGRELRELLRDLLDAHAVTDFDRRLSFSLDAMRGLALRRVLLGEQETETLWGHYRQLVVAVLGT